MAAADLEGGGGGGGSFIDVSLGVDLGVGGDGDGDVLKGDFVVMTYNSRNLPVVNFPCTKMVLWEDAPDFRYRTKTSDMAQDVRTFGPDIATFQEFFSDPQRHTFAHLMKNGGYHVTRFPNDKESTLSVGSGLLTISKHPIEESQLYYFSNAVPWSWDSYAKKGILFTRHAVRLPPRPQERAGSRPGKKKKKGKSKRRRGEHDGDGDFDEIVLGPSTPKANNGGGGDDGGGGGGSEGDVFYVHVYNVHLQSGDEKEKRARMRVKQLQEFMAYYKATESRILNGGGTPPRAVFLAGDLNINAVPMYANLAGHRNNSGILRSDEDFLLSNFVGTDNSPGAWEDTLASALRRSGKRPEDILAYTWKRPSYADELLPPDPRALETSGGGNADDSRLQRQDHLPGDSGSGDDDDNNRSLTDSDSDSHRDGDINGEGGGGGDDGGGDDAVYARGDMSNATDLPIVQFVGGRIRLQSAERLDYVLLHQPSRNETASARTRGLRRLQVVDYDIFDGWPYSDHFPLVVSFNFV